MIPLASEKELLNFKAHTYEMIVNMTRKVHTSTSSVSLQ